MKKKTLNEFHMTHSLRTYNQKGAAGHVPQLVV